MVVMVTVRVVVIVMIMRMLMDVIGTHFAAAVGHDAWYMLELNGGVVNSQPATNFRQFFENRFTLGMGHVVNQYV